MSVLLTTSLGDIVIDLQVEEEALCCNFIKLCHIKAYNFCLFFNVVKDFIAQTGDPSGSGQGGQSIWEVIDPGCKPPTAEARGKHVRGAVSMALAKGRYASQFFISLNDDTTLDGKHAVFGHVVEGFEVLNLTNQAFVDEQSRPLKDIRILHTVVLDDPFPHPMGMERYIPEQSPEPTEQQLADVRDGASLVEEDEETKAKSMREKEARAHALTLEMIGDLPFAEIAPPENVLFVCKLNPITTSEDLELIFSRFGKIVQCQIIKDRITGDSLQYAFIEFEQRESAERAYFKMDSVLIDDRRIKVDFSQSVSRLRNEVGLPRSKNMAGRRRSRSPRDRREMSMVFDLAERDREEQRRRAGRDGDRSGQREYRHHHREGRDRRRDEYHSRDRPYSGRDWR